MFLNCPRFQKLPAMLAVLVFGWSIAAAQPASVDTIRSFTEIRLSADGVIAFDSTNARWRYDFDETRFFREQVVSGQTDDRANVPEVSRRAVVERRIRPYAPSALVEYDEFVEDDIVVVGSITIRGWAKGNVQSISKRVIVAETGRVDGEIKAPEIIVRPGAQTSGREIITDELGSPVEKSGDLSFSEGVWIILACMLFLMLGAFLIHTLMNRQLAHIEKCLQMYSGRAFMIGLLTLVLIPFAILVLVITLVGALLVPFVPLVLLLAIVLGITATAGRIGRFAASRAGLDGLPQLSISLIGIALMTGLWLVVIPMLASGDDTVSGFGVVLLVLVILFWSYPIITGVGASAMTRLGWRPYVSFHDAAAAIPPIPAVPETNRADSGDHIAS